MKKYVLLIAISCASGAFAKPLNSMWKNKAGGFLDLRQLDLETGVVYLSFISTTHGQCKIKLTTDGTKFSKKIYDCDDEKNQIETGRYILKKDKLLWITEYTSELGHLIEPWKFEYN